MSIRAGERKRIRLAQQKRRALMRQKAAQVPAGVFASVIKD